jgi:hypothetical protein
MNNKLLRIEENTKFFEFIEEMVEKKIIYGIAKLKDGSISEFKYVTSMKKDGIIIHYIQLKEGGHDTR